MKTDSTAGAVSILNVGDGDLRLSFDKSNPAERIRAARVVKDMLRRGFALLVESSPGVYTRAKDFDEEHCEYIIADFDSLVAQDEDAKQQDATEAAHVTRQAEERPQQESQGETGSPTPTRRGAKTKRVDAGKTSAVAVPRISGG